MREKNFKNCVAGKAQVRRRGLNYWKLLLSGKIYIFLRKVIKCMRQK